jgi:plastocyanin
MNLRGSVVVLVLVIVAGSCGGSGDSPVTGPSTSTSIDVRDNFFSPGATTVPAGTTVTWTWRGAAPHDVSFNDGVHSITQTSGSYARQFTTAGPTTTSAAFTARRCPAGSWCSNPGATL